MLKVARRSSNWRMKLGLIRQYLTYLLAVIMVPVYAGQSPLLKCLGEEENKIHKHKENGPVYRLNQILINELIEGLSVEVKDPFMQEICGEGVSSPSIQLIKLLLLDGELIFEKGHSENIINQGAGAKSLLDQAPRFFFSYLADLQSTTPKSGCLEENIPEVKFFLERFKHLEAEISRSQLLDDKDKLESIFLKLQDFDGIVGRCLKKSTAAEKDHKNKLAP